MKTLRTTPHDWIKYAHVVASNGNTNEDALLNMRVDNLAKWLYAYAPNENDLFYLALVVRNRWIKVRFRFHKQNYNMEKWYKFPKVPIEWCELYKGGFVDRKVKGIHDLAFVKGDCLWLHPDWAKVFKDLSGVVLLPSSEELDKHFLQACRELARELIEKHIYFRPDYYQVQWDDFELVLHPNTLYGTRVSFEHYSKLLMPKEPEQSSQNITYYNRCPHIWIPDEELNLKGFD